MSLAEYEAWRAACYAEYLSCCAGVGATKRVPRDFKYLKLDQWKARIGYPKCSEELADCYKRCGPKPPPVPPVIPIPETETSWVDDFLNFLEETLDALGRALRDGARWLADHPEVVVGTIVIIAGVALVVTTGPGGALVLVAA